ncbi:unnamed protein product, partial [Phaeothamnion confervicola]
CIFLFRLGQDGTSSAARKWLLVAYVPDDAPVRQKMLYSSSRQDLKAALGQG